MGSNHRARRRAAALAGAVLTAALAAGCGIRTTSVPVDAGPAPSRVPCTTSSDDVTTQALRGIPVQIYLLCSSQLVAVDRAVRVDETASGTNRVELARALLAELRQRPPAEERQAGFTTAVPERLRIDAPRDGDPHYALRLGEQPEDLPAEALAQIVCTYAKSTTLAPGGTVVLGGPGKYPSRNYLCTAEMKARPQAVTTPSRNADPDADSGTEPGSGTGTGLGSGAGTGDD
ncbi:hypothetical protein [Streptomyces sp. NPDC056061]|uniref:hypothetical protein n=1 Tax=Streptomyces sp. NPDC056061 TaxID=3345700 RepID=UPI0035E0011B